MSTLNVIWTAPADAEVNTMTPDQCDGKDPRTWHEDLVKSFQQKEPALATANKARIRSVGVTFLILHR